MSHLAANLVICEAVLTEQTTEVISAIRTMNLLNITGQLQHARFFTLTLLASDFTDVSPHTLQIQMFTRDGLLVASAPPKTFFYGHGIGGPVGAFSLTTEFNLDLRPMASVGQYMLAAF